MTNPNDSAMPFALGGKTLNGEDDFIVTGLTKREIFSKDAPEIPHWFNTGDYVSEEDKFFSWRTYYADRLIEELNKTEK